MDVDDLGFRYSGKYDDDDDDDVVIIFIVVS